jgi:myotubularin-related protein 1/2
MSNDTGEEESLADPEKDQFRKKRSVEIFCHYIRTVRLSFSQQSPRADEEFVENLKVVFPASLKGVFAFTYKKMIGDIAEQEDGWNIYSLREEYKRIRAPSTGWRFTDLNRDYKYCKTYPQELIVPADITDEILKEVFQFRKMGRIPALTWKHPKNYACIIRCGQPQVGLSNERCEEDELLCAKALAATVGSDTLYLMDARPKVNAMANQAKGSGYENMQVYRNTKIKFLSILTRISFKLTEKI